MKSILSLSLSLPRRVPLLAAATAATALALLAGCQMAAPPTRFEVSSTAPADQQVEPGQRGTFEVTVKNVGSEAGYFSVSPQADEKADLTLVGCKRGIGMDCQVPQPGAQDAVHVPPGASLVFEVAYYIHGDASGAIETHIAVYGNSPMGSVDPFAVFHATVHDSRAGAYRLYAGDGAVRSADIDFAEGALVLHDPAADVPVSFDVRPDEPTYTISSKETFRAPRDLLLGTLDTGRGAQPFVAARVFATTPAALEGKFFDILGRAESPEGVATTLAYAAKVQGGALLACKAWPPAPVDGCPAEGQAMYPLEIAADGSFTGTDAARAERITFRVARSGDVLVFLAAESSAAGRRIEVGLEGAATLLPGAYQGGDSLGPWNELRVLPGVYWRGPTDAPSSGPTHRVDALAGYPLGLFAVDGGPMLVQHNPFALTAGQPGSLDDGVMAIWTAAP